MLNTKMIGNRIAEGRRKINISQAELAQRLFISSQAVGKWERGESMPDITTFNRLAEILGVDLNYFSENFQSETAEPVSVESPDKRSGELPSGPAISGKKLSWDMSNGNWVDADFSGLKNLHEKFSSSNIQRCLFIDSDLSGLLLKGNHVDSCNFSDSDISNSHIHNSHLDKNLFRNCSLEETEFSKSHIKSCDFSGTNFTAVEFKYSGFEKNTVTNSLWNRTSFIDTHIADTTFNGTLEDCYFEDCGFTRVIFQQSTLIHTFFKNRSLKGVQFIDCQADRLTFEFLKNGKADLTGITLLTS
ncbi:DNA-binding protein [Pedobacter lusitanus]|uniref:DNA-binding protein n=1 Tax=Pedobacter lusitanus TaxID=1503925 RepID=A0A0D0GRR9_9SPHI|nr:pentapeptide repeat-containing protein [Pedobacter lusitanus]KIO78890.1 DNA-binding protein [Pedobacter lusitanus]